MVDNFVYKVVNYSYMFIPRQAEQILRDDLARNKVVMVLGARQVGKTTLVRHIVSGQKTTSLNLDFEVDKNRLLDASVLTVEQAMARLGNPEVLVIDEAQRLPEVGRVVKSWYDSGVATKMVLLGSSSLNLLDQAAESLTGRNVKLLLPPLTFSEVVAAQPWNPGGINSKATAKIFETQLKEQLMQSIVFGSYPEAVITADKEDYLANLVSDYLLKDIFQSGLIKSPDLIKRLLTLLAHQVGSIVSTNELATTLGIARQTVERYLDLLERTFVIFRLSPYSTNLRKQVGKNKKIYFWDTGVRNAVLHEFSVSEFRGDIGALWENWVVAEIAKANLLSGSRYDLYFWRSYTGSEVDLVIKRNEKLRAFEIKWSRDAKVNRKAFEEAYGTSVELISASPESLFLLTSWCANKR